MVTIDRHIHQPLARLAATNDIRCPLIALDTIATGLPAMNIEIAKAHGLTFTVLHLSDGLGVVGVGIADLYTGSIGKERACISLPTTEVSPVEHIGGLGGSEMRAKEIVVAAVGNNGGIMDGHLFVADARLVVGISSYSAEGEQADGSKELKMLHNYQLESGKAAPTPLRENGERALRYLLLITYRL